MKKLKIRDFIYFNTLRDKYLNLNNLEIYSKEKLIAEYGFEEENFSDLWDLKYTYNLIPLFVYDNEKILREYLSDMKNKKIDKIIENMTYDELDIWFFRQWEVNRYFGDWYKYYDDKIMELAVAWCKENNIPFEM